MYIAEIMYRGDLHNTMFVNEKTSNNFDLIKQEIDLNYPGEEDHVRVILIDQEDHTKEDITGEITCSQK